MKRALALAAAVLLLGGLTGCSGGDDATEAGAGSTPATSPATSPGASPETSPGDSPESSPGDSPESSPGDSAEAGSPQAYCRELKQAQKEFSALETGDVTAGNLDRIFDVMHQLADRAPAKISDEWQTLDGAISQMENGLKELGLTFGDLADPEKLQDVDPKKLQQFGEDMRKLGGKKFQQAGDAIEQHARSSCGIKLGQQQN